MHQGIYNRLLQVARTGRDVIYYSDIAPLAGLDMASPPDRDEISRLLDEISNHEHTLGRPLLSALVIRRDTNIPGDGFFALATQLGFPNVNNHMPFFISELRRVHDYWLSH